MYITVPVEPTSDKQEFSLYIASFLYNESIAALGPGKGRENVKSFNINKIRELHNILVSGEYEYIITRYIKKSLKLSYGGGRLFGLSTIKMNEYLTDVRDILQRM